MAKSYLSPEDQAALNRDTGSVSGVDPFRFVRNDQGTAQKAVETAAMVRDGFSGTPKPPRDVADESKAQSVAAGSTVDMSNPRIAVAKAQAAANSRADAGKALADKVAGTDATTGLDGSEFSRAREILMKLSDLGAQAQADTYTPTGQPQSQASPFETLTPKGTPAEINKDDPTTWPPGWTKRKPPTPNYIDVPSPKYTQDDVSGLWSLDDPGYIIAGAVQPTSIMENGKRVTTQGYSKPQYVEGDQTAVLSDATRNDPQEIANVQQALVDAGLLKRDEFSQDAGTLGASTVGAFKGLLGEANRAGRSWQEQLLERQKRGMQRLRDPAQTAQSGYTDTDHVTILKEMSRGPQGGDNVLELQVAMVKAGLLSDTEFKKTPGTLDGTTISKFKETLTNASITGQTWQDYLNGAIDKYENDPDLRAALSGVLSRNDMLGLTGAKKRSASTGGGGGGAGGGGGGGGSVVGNAANQVTSQMQALAADFGVPLAPRAAASWMQNVLNGQASYDDYKAYLQEQATSRYPWMAEQIQRGQTVRQLWEPYAQIAGRVLGVPPETLTMNDPRWLASLDYMDPTTGKQRPMSINEWQQYLKREPQYGYAQSKDATDTASTFISMLGNIFGKA